MSDFKKCNVIILPTEKIIKFDPLYQVWAIPVGGMIIANDDSVGKCLKRGEVTHHQLYITSDEEIKLGDYYYRPGFNEIFRGSGFVEGDSKVVASTEKLNELPQIPRSFIKQYVESGGSIDEIDMFNQNIETDSGDYIILKPTKKYWTREEVEQFRDLANAIINSASEVLGEEYDEEYENYFNWIEQNL